MMKTMLIRLIPATLLAAILVAACDSPTASLIESEQSGVSEFTSVLTEELQLSTAQQEVVRVELRRHPAPQTDPISLWHVAARLQQTLTENQKQLLFRLMQREQQRHQLKLAGVYGACAAGPADGAERPAVEREGTQTRTMKVKRLMAQVLGLSDTQLNALDQLHRDQCATVQRLTEQARAGSISRAQYHSGLTRAVNAKMEFLARLLDEQQFEIVEIHSALLVIQARRYLYHIGQ